MLISNFGLCPTFQQPNQNQSASVICKLNLDWNAAWKPQHHLDEQ